MTLSRMSFWALVLVSVAYLAFPNARLDFTPYNSHDSESYMALSTSLLEGHGYTRSLNEGEYVPHTLWPPGMATLLMPAIIASGDEVNLYWVKYTIILMALAAVWLTRYYLILLKLPVTAANIVALLVLLNPFYWHFSRIAMAEIPTFTWYILSLVLIHLSFSKLQSHKIVAASGLVAGLGMMIKGALLGLPLALLPYLWKQGLFSRQSITRGLVFGIAFCVPFVIWMARNSGIDTQWLGLDGVNQVQMITKKVIEDPNSDFKTSGEIIQTAKQNLLWHAIYHVPTHTIPGLYLLNISELPKGNIIALLLSAAVFVLIGLQFSRFLPVIISAFPAFAIVIVMTIGGAERYWFSLMSIFLMVIYAAPFALVKRQSLQYSIAGVLVLLQVISLVTFISRHEAHPFTSAEHRDDLAVLFTQIKPLCAETAKTGQINVWAPNNHALQLSTDCQASMVNTRIGLDPTFDYAILSKEKLATPYPEFSLEAGNYVLVQLPSSMTQDEIKMTYYGK